MLKKYHFIGIGGIGMSGLARILMSKQLQVSGSDRQRSTLTDQLQNEGAQIFIGHSASLITPDMTVVYSTDIKKDNPEFETALALKCPLIHRSELLQLTMQESQALAVAGTHGKTTTSSLLAWVLKSAGLSPSFAIGGVVPQLSANGGGGTGKFFVAEACESDGSFQRYSPFGAIVTNIDFDHMDYYGSEQALVDAFKAFMCQVASSEHLFWCGDDIRLKKLQMPGISYGFDAACHLRASNFQQQGWTAFFDVEYRGKTYRHIELPLVGVHNATNALAVFGLALNLGLDEMIIRSALQTFQGVLRRCERKGEQHGILFLDDYAHHPTEIRATLKAMRKAAGERRLVVVYQPHRFSRAKGCIGQYADAFSEADALFVTEIYAAGEQAIPGISHEMIVQEIQQNIPGRCQYLARKEAAAVIASFLRPHDLCISLGAGDITHLAQELSLLMKHKAPPKLKVGVVFGGMSVEHDVSLLSVKNILGAMSKDYYELEEFGITRQGRWVPGKFKEEEQAGPLISADLLQRLLHCDILFPVMHGPNGEDGTLQGFFEILSKAYTGPDHRSAAICMDKALSKRLAKERGLPILPFVTFNRFEWDNARSQILEKIEAHLKYPLFIKPVHLGSSIGVHKVCMENALSAAIEEAFRLDTQVIVENGLERPREIEFSLIGNDEVTVFPPGEVYVDGNIHDYDSKYGWTPEKPAAQFAERAQLPEHKISEGMELAKQVYLAVGCTGMARVDTFLDAQGKYWFNEINPIPGFTQHSLYPTICGAHGLPLSKLIDRLIILGLQRRRFLERLTYIEGF